MPHRHIHPKPSLIISPFEAVAERFNAARYEFPRHMTDVPPFTIPRQREEDLLDRVEEFTQNVREFEVSFGDPTTFEHNGVKYHVQKVETGRLRALELHLGLLGIIRDLGGEIEDHMTSGLYFNPHTNLMTSRAPYTRGQLVPVRTVMVIAKYPKGFIPIGEHQELGDVRYKTIYQGYRLRGEKVTIDL